MAACSLRRCSNFLSANLNFTRAPNISPVRISWAVHSHQRLRKGRDIAYPSRIWCQRSVLFFSSSLSFSRSLSLFLSLSYSSYVSCTSHSPFHLLPLLTSILLPLIKRLRWRRIILWWYLCRISSLVRSWVREDLQLYTKVILYSVFFFISNCI